MADEPTTTEAPAEEAAPVAPQLSVVPDAPEAEPEPTVPEVVEEEPTEADLAHEEFLKERGLAADSTEPPSTEKPIDPSVDAEVERRIAERTAAAQTAAQLQQLQQTFDQTPVQIYQSLVADGVTPQRAQQYYEAIVGLTRAAEPVLGKRGSETARAELSTEFNHAMGEHLSASDRKKLADSQGTEHKTVADAVKFWADSLRKGMVSEKDAKAREAKAVTDYKAYLETKGLIVGGRAPKVGEGGTTSISARMTTAQIEAMPTSQWMSMPSEQRQKLLDNARRAG